MDNWITLKLLRLLPLWAGLGIIGGPSCELWGQTTYTYNGSSWSDGSGAVSGPGFNANSSLSISSGTVSLSPMQQTSNTAAINSRFAIYQTITPLVTAEVKSITIWAETVPSSTYTVVLQLYSGNPVGANTLMASVSKFTGALEMKFDLPAGVQVTAGGDYFIRVVHQTVNAWRWKLGAVNSLSSEVLYLPWESDPPVNTDARSLNFRMDYDFELSNLSLSVGAVLSSTLLPIAVQGNLSNNGQINLSASSGGYSQLKVDGTVSGTGSVVQNMYVSGTGYHALASSMAGGFGTTSASTGGLYSYNASTGAYNFSPSLSAAGTGYFGLLGTGGFISGAGTFSVSGTPNTSHTHSLGYASSVATGGSGNGWNLVGNPYTCALDWTAVTKSLGVNNAFYIWNPVTSTYDYYVNGVAAPTGTYAGSSIASPYIAPLQAFWVQTTSSGQTLTSTMATAGTVAASPSYYKTLADQLILLVREVGDPSKSDALWIKDVASATIGFDSSEDAWKMSNYGGQPSISVATLDGLMAVNALPISAGTTVDVQFSASAVGRKYAMELQVPQGEFNVLLEDRATGTFTDMLASNYSFTDVSFDGPRFALHLASAALATSNEKPEISLWAFVGDAEIMVHGVSAGLTVQLLSIDGRVLDQVLATDLATRFFKPLEQGMYMLRCGDQTLKILVP